MRAFLSFLVCRRFIERTRLTSRCSPYLPAPPAIKTLRLRGLGQHVFLIRCRGEQFIRYLYKLTTTTNQQPLWYLDERGCSQSRLRCAGELSASNFKLVWERCTGSCSIEHSFRQYNCTDWRSFCAQKHASTRQYLAIRQSECPANEKPVWRCWCCNPEPAAARHASSTA